MLSLFLLCCCAQKKISFHTSSCVLPLPHCFTREFCGKEQQRNRLQKNPQRCHNISVLLIIFFRKLFIKCSCSNFITFFSLNFCRPWIMLLILIFITWQYTGTEITKNLVSLISFRSTFSFSFLWSLSSTDFMHFLMRFFFNLPIWLRFTTILLFGIILRIKPITTPKLHRNDTETPISSRIYRNPIF